MPWKVGQTVMVQSRTWAGINKPGGCAKITKVHTNRDCDDDLDDDEISYVEGLDVKYVLGGGTEKNLDPAIVAPYEILERGRRSRSRPTLFEAGRPCKDNTNHQKSNKSSSSSSSKKKEPSQPLTKKTKEAKAMEMAMAEAPQLPLPGASPRILNVVVPNGKENQNGKPRSRESEATCSTPDPPRQRRKKLPKKVTPIPKMVLVTSGSKDDVSPMWMDVATSSSSSSSSAAASYTTAAAKKPNAGSKTSVARGLNFEEKAPSKLPQHPIALQQRRTECERKSGNNNIDLLSKDRKQPPVPSKNEARIYYYKKVKRVVHPSGTTMATLPSHQPPRFHHTNSTKPKAPTHASFSRATSAYAKRKKENQHRKPLLDIYRSEVEKARKFMDEMVGPPQPDNNNIGNRIQDEDFNPRTQPSKESAAPKSRYDEFLSHLYKVWMKLDAEDEISEERFKDVFQTITGGSFSASELDIHLSALCDEGKEVMRSDGMLYRIE